MVELAFEGHRFWDVRRWKEADKYFVNIEGLQISKQEIILLILILQW